MLGRAIFGFVVLTLAGCGAANSSPKPSDDTTTAAKNKTIRAVCTTGMVADLVRHVGGSHVNVIQIMGEGVDPHLYKASPGDIHELGSADIIFYSGLHLEGKMGEIFGRLARTKKTVAIAESLPKSSLLELEKGVHDPHVWFDVSLWSQTLDAVAKSLSDYDPPHADEYRQKAADYRKELDAVHDSVKKELEAIPKDQRLLATAHDAFHYFGRAYDVEVKAIQGISTESEAGVHEINGLVDLLVKRKIKAVFVETSVSDRNIQALVEGCRARGHQIQIGGSLYSDAMGTPGTPEGTYVGMVRHNVNAIVRGLR